jgi:hypothetical protein
VGLTMGINFQAFFKKGSRIRTFVKYYKIPYSFMGVFQELNSHATSVKYGNDVFNY